jgi:hypothetical protein
LDYPPGKGNATDRKNSMRRLKKKKMKVSVSKWTCPQVGTMKKCHFSRINIYFPATGEATSAQILPR